MRARSTISILVIVGLGATLPACGGGGGGPSTTTVALVADPAYDGTARVDGYVGFSPASASMFTGDYGATYYPEYFSRQLYAFNLAPVPRSARIVRATLRLYQADVVGEPYFKNGDVVVDHVDYFPDPGPDSYDGQTLARNIGTLSTSPALGWRSLDVTAAVVADLDGGALWSQYRLRFWAERTVAPDHVDDYAYFADAETTGPATDGQEPQLVVEYE